MNIEHKMDLPFEHFTLKYRLDAGVDGSWLFDSMPFESFEDFRTWTLPQISPQTGESDAVKEKDDIILELDRSELGGRPAFTWTLRNTGEKVRWINGALLALELDLPESADFPAATPTSRITEFPEQQVITCGLSSPFLHLEDKGKHLNLYMDNRNEKVSTGIYRTGDKLQVIYVPSIELNLEPDETVLVGTLILEEAEEPYLAFRALVDELGFKAIQDGISDGVMYSCHPGGTMDAGFPDNYTLSEYKKFLPDLKDMGVDHVWLLPVFDHGDEGVYHSTDQAIIDERYGGDGATAEYVKAAHDLGLTVSFDYVPHGPNKEEPLAKRTVEWCSVRRDGTLQEEWNCVSYDYNQPGYLEYTRELVEDHIKRFDIDGARIDCAMGGLSNWQPYEGERPSASNLRAGMQITDAIRQAFLNKGKKPLILPENFHPHPMFYPVTDVFYGFNLYRVLDEIGPLLAEDPARYAALMTDWLKREQEVTPENFSKLRFLGNHDTVSWVWQAARAVDFYGEGGARALWALMSLIDGMVMIYQGDEDPSLSHGSGPVLRDFFRELFGFRKLMAAGGKTRYEAAEGAVMHFFRYRDDGTTFEVKINLGSEPVVIDSGGLREDYQTELPAYQYQLWER